MDFSQADHGVSIDGMRKYVEALNIIVLKNVAQAIRDTEGIKSAVESGWVGASAEQFLRNLNKAKEEVIKSLKDLSTALETELEGIQSQIIDMDERLVVEE